MKFLMKSLAVILSVTCTFTLLIVGSEVCKIAMEHGKYQLHVSMICYFGTGSLLYFPISKIIKYYSNESNK